MPFRCFQVPGALKMEHLFQSFPLVSGSQNLGSIGLSAVLQAMNWSTRPMAPQKENFHRRPSFANHVLQDNT